MDGQIQVRDGRSVGFFDYGEPSQTAVLYCHGGPGSRLEPQGLSAAATAAGFRLIGIDRPGYGKSTPQRGRRIGDWVTDALEVADHLRIDRFATVGVSTGGAYALAVAAFAPSRVLGVAACCALTDMRWAEGKAMMSGGRIDEIWAATDREAALAISADVFGADGRKMLAPAAGAPALPPADLALLTDPTWLAGMLTGFPAMFAHGPAGYTDDRLADGPGWGSFDVSKVACPVIILHGGKDTIVPVAHAHHTAAIVPSAKLVIFDDLGHFSISGEIVGQLTALLRS